MKISLRFRILFYVSVFIFIGLAVAACGKHKDPPDDKTLQTKFGTEIPDTMVTMSNNLPPIKPAAFSDGGRIQIPSINWIGLSEQMMETGETLQGEDQDLFLKFGHRLNQEFYDLPESHTTMDAISAPPGNPYTEAADAYADPILEKKIGEAVDATEGKVQDAASQIEMGLDALPKDPLPEVLIQRIVGGLLQFRDNLVKSKDGTGDAFVDKITDTLNNEYIKDLSGLRDSAKLDRPGLLSASMAGLSASLGKLSEISDREKKRLQFQVQRGESLAKRCEALNNASDALKLLVDFWLSKDFRALYPADLKNVFANLNDSEILAMGTGDKAPLYQGAEWERVKARTDLSLMPDLEVIAQFTQNNGNVLGQKEWNQIVSDQMIRLDGLLKNPDISNLVDLIAVNDTVADDYERRGIIVNDWLNLGGRMSFPAKIRAAFARFNDSDLEKVEDDSTMGLLGKAHFELMIARHELLDGIEEFGAKPGQKITAAEGLANFQKLFNGQIIAATRARLDHSLWPIAQGLQKQLTDNLLPTLNDQKAQSAKMADDSFKIYSRYYMGKVIFGAGDLIKGSEDSNNEASDNAVLARHPLPILERENVNLIARSGQFISVPSEDETTPELLGRGLSASFYRLNSAAKYEQIGSQTQAAMALNFESIAKMMALAGYRGYDGQLTESLSVPMSSGHLDDLLDIHHYDPDKVVFAVPDDIKIRDRFKLDRANMTNNLVSVRGQMELLSGFSKMMHYFKPWEVSPFDASLGAFRIDEDPTMVAFDKNDFYLLSLGLASVVMKNLPLRMIGLITDTGDFKEAGNVPDTSKLNLTGAVLGDYSVTRMSHVVNAHDMALGIDAISEFYEASKDLEKSNDPAVIDALRTSPMDGVRTDLKKLLSGMVLFSTGKLLQKDGGFVTSYDGDSKLASTGPRKLEDQLLMQRALVRAGHLLDSNFILAKAGDNFFFMNSHLWDASTGFYQSIEGKRDAKIKLENVALALENAALLTNVLPNAVTQSDKLSDSLAQLKKLNDFWLKRFFGPEFQNAQAPVQVSEFSL